MQKVKQTPTFKLLITPLLALFTMVLLFSCSKNIAEIPGQNNPELSASNQSSPSHMNNGLAVAPFESTLFVPCANGGAGEDVALTGKTNFIYQMSWNEHGFSLVYHDNSYGVTGVGLSSGETFTASGGTQETVMGSWVNNQWIGTLIRQLRIIGQGSSFIVNYKYRITVTPDGNVTVNIREETIDCR
jgi:hypothetical protein